ncbi:MAG: alpha/beta hydrolase [Bacteroidota bacterium]
MKTLEMIKPILPVLMLLVFNNPSFSQKLDPKERIIEPDHIITSEITKRNYQLFISFPNSYSTKDTISYPVLYVLDGERNFDFFYRPNIFLSAMGKIEQTIIVGIDSGKDRKAQIVNRTYHFTPTIDKDSSNVRQREKSLGLAEGTLLSGAAADFLKVIKTEIAPFIDENYKTNADRGISGHSLGGLFTAYCLVNSDGYFTRFGINSPSLWWNEEEFLNQAVQQFEDIEDWEIPPTKVFISSGGDEGIYILPTTIKFYTHLKNANYKNIELNWQIFDNENHVTVRPLSLRQTIIELYGKE